MPDTAAALATPSGTTGVGILSLGSRTGNSTCNVPPLAPTPSECNESDREEHPNQDTVPRIPEACEFHANPIPSKTTSSIAAETQMP